MTSYGKGDIDWIGGTCKRHVREKTYTCLVFSKNSFEFSEFCPNINAMHCSKAMHCIVKRSNLRKRG